MGKESVMSMLSSGQASSLNWAKARARMLSLDPESSLEGRNPSTAKLGRSDALRRLSSQDNMHLASEHPLPPSPQMFSIPAAVGVAAATLPWQDIASRYTWCTAVDAFSSVRRSLWVAQMEEYSPFSLLDSS
jgi:hypothetical protein